MAHGSEGAREITIDLPNVHPEGGNESLDSEIGTMAKSLLETVERHDNDGVHLILELVGVTVLLHHAAENGNEQLVKFLRDYLGDNLSVNSQDRVGRTALIIASWKGNTEILRLLLCMSADVLTSTEDGFTCLHMAAFGGHTEVVNLLVHGKSPRECWDEWDRSLPHLQLRRRWALLDRKSDSELFTALHMAASGDHDQGAAIATSLLEAYRTSVLEFYGLASNPKNAYEIENEWWDFLFQIRNYLNLQSGEVTSQTLVENLVSNEIIGRGSALHKKLLEKYEGFVRSLVELILYSNAGDKIGRTALHHATWENNAEVVKFLTWNSHLGSVANLNAPDVDGYTPLHLASWKGCTDVVVALTREELFKNENRLVEKFYLQPNVAATPNHRSRQIANKLDDIEHERLWLVPRPRLQNLIWAEDRGGVTPLHYAIEKEHVEIVNSILKHPEIDVFQRSNDGKSPWTIAFPTHRYCELYGTSASDIQRLLREGPRPRPRSLQTEMNRLLDFDYSDAREASDLDYRETRETRDHFWKSINSYRRKLVKQAGVLAIATEEDSTNIDIINELLVLEMQVFVAFAQGLGVDQDFFERWLLWWERNFSWKDAVGNLRKREDGSQWVAQLHGAIATYGQYDQKLETPKGLHWATLLHVAAYEGFDQELEMLLTLKRYRWCINDRENLTEEGYTALHFATMKCNVGAMRVLLNEKTLHPAMKNKEGLMASQTIQQKLDSNREKRESLPGETNRVLEIIMRDRRLAGIEFERSQLVLAQRLLMDHPEVVEECYRQAEESYKEVERLYRDRQVYVDAANAILVGAALIASVTFAGWLQPPLGYTQYYQKSFPYPAPPSTPESFAAIEQHKSVGVFWIFNSLSFYSAIATVVTGAGAVLSSKRVTGAGDVLPSERVTRARAVLPSELKSFKTEVDFVRKWLNVTSALLSISIFFVLGAFTAAGSASLPTIGKDQMNMIWTAAIGLCLCLVILSGFCYRLYLATGRPKDWEAIMFLLLMFVFVTIFVETRPLMHRIGYG